MPTAWLPSLALTISLQLVTAGASVGRVSTSNYIVSRGCNALALGAVALGRVRSALALCPGVLDALSKNMRSDSATHAIRARRGLRNKNGPPGGAGRWGRDGASGERRGESATATLGYGQVPCINLTIA